MAAKARPKNPQLSHKFVGRIEDMDIAWFSKIGGFSSEIEIVEAHQGGQSNIAWHSPGKRKYTALEVMVVGSDNRELHDWHERAAATADIEGVPDDDVKKTFWIDVYGVGSKKMGRWVFEEAWVSKHTPGEYDSSASKFTEETATIKYTRYRWEPAP